MIAPRSAGFTFTAASIAILGMRCCAFQKVACSKGPCRYIAVHSPAHVGILLWYVLLLLSGYHVMNFGLVCMRYVGIHSCFQVVPWYDFWACTYVVQWYLDAQTTGKERSLLQYHFLVSCEDADTLRIQVVLYVVSTQNSNADQVVQCIRVILYIMFTRNHNYIPDIDTLHTYSFVLGTL